MKFRYCFALVAVLLILLSIACVSAGENITGAVSVQEDAETGLEAAADGADVLSSKAGADLSVDMTVEPSYEDNKYNKVGSEVPWTITVSSNKGTAHNVKVRDVLSVNLGYVSHSTTVGQYDSSSGIWDVGDLAGSEKATLTIWTKLKIAGTYLNKVYATSDSNDADLLNNFKFLSISTGSSKITSNITETTDDRYGAGHDVHYASMIKNRIKGGKGKQPDPKPDPKPKPGPGPSPNPGPGEGGWQGGSYYSVAKSTSFFDEIFNAGDDSANKTSGSKGNPFSSFFDSVEPYDYYMIPILIFGLFLILFAAAVIYGASKSKF